MSDPTPGPGVILAAPEVAVGLVAVAVGGWMYLAALVDPAAATHAQVPAGVLLVALGVAWCVWGVTRGGG